MAVVHRYNNQRYDFSSLMRALLDVEDLSALHSDAMVSAGESLYKSMESASLYRKMLDVMVSPESEDFYKTYWDFVKSEIAPRFDEPILAQARPTMRIVFANIGGEPRFHRDRDYGHDSAEVNYIVPLTESLQSASVWIETSEGANDHRPIDMHPGEYLEFDGASLSHGAVANISGRSRVSFDFRVITASKLSPSRHIVSADPPAQPDPRIFSVVAV